MIILLAQSRALGLSHQLDHSTGVTPMAAVREFGQPLVDDPDRLSDAEAIGVDETAFLAATAASHTQFVTGIVALTKPARLLDVVPGRTAMALSGSVSAQPEP